MLCGITKGKTELEHYILGLEISFNLMNKAAVEPIQQQQLCQHAF
jgi:hypothetical protein